MVFLFCLCGKLVPVFQGIGGEHQHPGTCGQHRVVGDVQWTQVEELEAGTSFLLQVLYTLLCLASFT